jgi:hypothetical protein
MDVASPIASRVAGQPTLSSGNPFKTAMRNFAARFAFTFGWLGDGPGHVPRADHPPATGYRHRP